MEESQSAPNTECCANTTAYVSMLPYAYTNNDVAQLFSRFGKIARVTILRNKDTRKSKGFYLSLPDYLLSVAFVQFAKVHDCERAVAAMNGFELESFSLVCKMSQDNGRSQEFMKKRKYPKKNVCFECGEEGHVSYKCPRNVLGERSVPKKQKKRKKFEPGEVVAVFDSIEEELDSEGIVSIPPSVLAYTPDPSANRSNSRPEYSPLHTRSAHAETSDSRARKTLRRDSYFSDEDASD